MSHPFITESEDGDLLYIKTPYNSSFVDDLKGLIDKDDRKWDREEKRWEIDLAYEEEVEKLVRNYWGTGARRSASTATSHGGASPTGRQKSPPPHGAPTPPRRSAAPTRERTSTTSDPIESVDDYVTRIAQEDVGHVIKELTAKVGALTYELDEARRVASSAQREAEKDNAATRRAERQIADLTFKLTMAEAKAKASTPSPSPRVDEFLRNGGSNAAAYRTLHLAPDAPPTLVEAARRTLMKTTHPDVGGDPDKARAVNQAADRILGK